MRDDVRISIGVVAAYVALQCFALVYEILFGPGRAFAESRLEAWSMMRDSCDRPENYRSATCAAARDGVAGGYYWMRANIAVERLSRCVIECPNPSTTTISVVLGALGAFAGAYLK